MRHFLEEIIDILGDTLSSCPSACPSILNKNLIRNILGHQVQFSYVTLWGLFARSCLFNCNKDYLLICLESQSVWGFCRRQAQWSIWRSRAPVTELTRSWLVTVRKGMYSLLIQVLMPYSLHNRGMSHLLKICLTKLRAPLFQPIIALM